MSLQDSGPRRRVDPHTLHSEVGESYNTYTTPGGRRRIRSPKNKSFPLAVTTNVLPRITVQLAASAGTVTNAVTVTTIEAGGQKHTLTFWLSATPSGAASHPHITVYGRYLAPSAGPTAVNTPTWSYVCADTASGATGTIVSGLSVSGGTVKSIIFLDSGERKANYANQYYFVVSAGANVAVSEAVNLTYQLDYN